MWGSILAGGAFLSGDLSSHLTTSLTVPGSESEKAEEILNSKFLEKSEGFLTIIYRFGTLTKGEIEDLKAEITECARVLPNSRIIQQQAIAGTLITVLASDETLQESSANISLLRSELQSSGLKDALVSGPPAIFHDVEPVLAQDLHRGQILAITLAGFLLLLTLGLSWALLVPIIFALSSVALTLGILSLLSEHLLLVLYIPNIVELIGFGLAIDYSLLAIHRFRKEARNSPSASNHELVLSTMRTAGKTVLISGITVSIALSTLMLFPIPFLQSLGIASALVPLSSSLAALTLLPVLLLMFGRGG
jgi:RND superfamily putative drug exporter